MACEVGSSCVDWVDCIFCSCGPRPSCLPSGELDNAFNAIGAAAAAAIPTHASGSPVTGLIDWNPPLSLSNCARSAGFTCMSSESPYRPWDLSISAAFAIGIELVNILRIWV